MRGFQNNNSCCRIQIGEYKKLAKIGPVLLLLVIVIIGLLTRVWWTGILYLIVLAVYIPSWKKSITLLEEGKCEMEASLKQGQLELSDKALKIYNSNQASSGALIFGIVSLGIITIVCCVLGGMIIRLAFYETFDLPIFFVGMFLLLCGLFAMIPTLKWAFMLPKASKIKA